MDMESVKAFFASLTLERLAPALLVLAVGLLAAKALIKLFEKLLARSKIDKTIHGFLRAAFKILLYSIVVLMILGALGFMVGTGGAAIVAKTLGEGKPALANQYFTLLVLSAAAARSSHIMPTDQHRLRFWNQLRSIRHQTKQCL